MITRSGPTLGKSEFEATLGYMRPCLKEGNGETSLIKAYSLGFVQMGKNEHSINIQ